MKTHLAIHVYGDSLSLPRTSDGVAYYDTYPELLREKIECDFPAIRVALYNRSQGGGFISGLLTAFVNDAAFFGRDGERVLVIQTGIVDCAPRPIPMETRSAIGKLPVPARWAIAKVLHFLRPWLLRHGKSWRQTSAEEYREKLLDWLRRASRAFDRVYVLNIAPTVPSIEAHSPGLHASIIAYNQIIGDGVNRAAHANVRLIDVYAVLARDDRGLASLINEKDGHHITRMGHQLYADMLWGEERPQLARGRESARAASVLSGS